MTWTNACTYNRKNYCIVGLFEGLKFMHAHTTETQKNCCIVGNFEGGEFNFDGRLYA